MCQYDYYCFFHFSMFVGITFEKKKSCWENLNHAISFFFTRKPLLKLRKGWRLKIYVLQTHVYFAKRWLFSCTVMIGNDAFDMCTCVNVGFILIGVACGTHQFQKELLLTAYLTIIKWRIYDGSIRTLNYMGSQNSKNRRSWIDFYFSHTPFSIFFQEKVF